MLSKGVRAIVRLLFFSEYASLFNSKQFYSMDQAAGSWPIVILMGTHEEQYMNSIVI